MEKLKINFPIIVEGKYDKIKILSIADASVFTTDGFGVFKNAERLALLRRLAEKSRIILLTDSDGAGKLIRSHITSAIPKDRIIQLYTPQIEGKEKRKQTFSAEGFLGVEGVEAELLRKLLLPFSADNESDFCSREEITKADFYTLGLTGGENCSEKRDMLAVRLGLPKKMTPNAMLSSLNILMDRKELFALAEELNIK